MLKFASSFIVDVILILFLMEYNSLQTETVIFVFVLFVHFVCFLLPAIVAEGLPSDGVQYGLLAFCPLCTVCIVK